jgi:phospholipid/cholesterol/gamma-HCH transport system ATP-binding protein
MSESQANQEPIARLSNVHFGFRHNLLFKGIDIEIPRGKITTIMGASGTGKTTLLRLISGQLKPQRGDVYFDGLHVNALSRSQLFEMRKRMGMMFQSSALLTDLTVFGNVAYPIRENTALPEELIRSVVLMKLNAVGLRGARDLMPAELSGGMIRRVALARAIALDPMMILYDDPFSGLDPITLGVIMRLVKTLNNYLGITSVLVSHDVDEVVAISDYLYMIGDGKVQAKGTPEELSRTRDPWTDQFIHAKPDGPVSFHFPAGNYEDELVKRKTAG